MKNTKTLLFVNPFVKNKKAPLTVNLLRSNKKILLFENEQEDCRSVHEQRIGELLSLLIKKERAPVFVKKEKESSSICERRMNVFSRIPRDPSGRPLP